MSDLILKIVHAEEWRAVEAAGVYRGSLKDREDGFLHFSTAPQLMETLRRYYADASDLLLVAVDEANLGAALKYEHAPSRGEDFPHLYGVLQIKDVTWARPITRDADGAFVLPL